jgi:2C-methyl-D-erythritol 2,4-cyclodiphosphate synthase
MVSLAIIYLGLYVHLIYHICVLLIAEFDVGLITVYMSINVTYPNLKPHLHELAELLAKELEIDSRQVRIKHNMTL